MRFLLGLTLVITASSVLFSVALALGPRSSDPEPYPLSACFVSGEALGSNGEPVTKEHDGRELRFCCKMCVKDFEKDGPDVERLIA